MAFDNHRDNEKVQRYIDKIIAEEGDHARMYKCPAGKWTIGSGINLEAQEMPREVRFLWLSMIVGDLIKAVDRRLYLNNYLKCLNTADVRLVLVDMAYQLGLNGLLKFTKMLTALQQNDYEKAADELLDSNYAKQTPARAKRNAAILRKIVT